MFNNDISIDLGTATVLVYIKNKGIVLREPTVIAVNTKTNEVCAVGKDALAMLGRTPPHIQAVRPLTGDHQIHRDEQHAPDGNQPQQEENAVYRTLKQLLFSFHSHSPESAGSGRVDPDRPVILFPVTLPPRHRPG